MAWEGLFWIYLGFAHTHLKICELLKVKFKKSCLQKTDKSMHKLRYYHTKRGLLICRTAVSVQQKCYVFCNIYSRSMYNQSSSKYLSCILHKCCLFYITKYKFASKTMCVHIKDANIEELLTLLLFNLLLAYAYKTRLPWTIWYSRVPCLSATHYVNKC